MWRDLGSKNANILTLEASFCGPKPVRHEPHRERLPYISELNYHFNTEDYMKIGMDLCETLLLYRAEEESAGGLKTVEQEVINF